jgi:hypothetical protein
VTDTDRWAVPAHVRAAIEAEFPAMVRHGYNYTDVDEVSRLSVQLARVLADDPPDAIVGRLVCGRCGAVVARLLAGVDAVTSWPTVRPVTGSFVAEGGPHDPNSARALPVGLVGPTDATAASRWSLRCGGRHGMPCTAVHTVRAVNLVRAFVRAAQAGNRRLVVGPGPAADRRGIRNL